MQSFGFESNNNALGISLPPAENGDLGSNPIPAMSIGGGGALGVGWPASAATTPVPGSNGQLTGGLSSLSNDSIWRNNIRGPWPGSSLINSDVINDITGTVSATAAASSSPSNAAKGFQDMMAFVRPPQRLSPNESFQTFNS